MNAAALLKELESYGSEQSRKIYRRHGAGDNIYGVSFANLKKMVKRIGNSTPLAEELWKSGNVDARTLALMIADPATISRECLETWAHDVEYYMLSGYLGALIARSPHGAELIAEWTESPLEFVRSSGYDAICTATKEYQYLSVDTCRNFLTRIEREIHSSANRARYSMNTAMICIGVYVPALYEEALACATRIGKVEVHHGTTGCKTPDAHSYIQKAVQKISSKKAKSRAS